jgi:exonuclease III
MISSLRILSWNANGLQSHQKELQVVLDTDKIDVCLISETHFTSQSYVKFKGYSVYHTIHPNNTPRGGSAVVIKENIQHFEDVKIEENEMQVTSIIIKTKNYPIRVAGIYCPPRHALKKD